MMAYPLSRHAGRIAQLAATGGKAAEMGDDFNMSMRKFLKQVGVTSQQAIEAAIRDSADPGRSFAAKAVITIEDLGLEHVVTGTIRGRD